MTDVERDLRPRLVVTAAVLAALLVSLVQGVVRDGIGDFDEGHFAARLAGWTVFLVALQVANLILVKSKQRRGDFVVVLGGYDREEVDGYLARLATARAAGLPAPSTPKFTTALRGYEPTQIDQHLTTLLELAP